MDGVESDVDNLELRCRPQNAYEAERWEGTLFTRESVAPWYSVQDRAIDDDHADGARAAPTAGWLWRVRGGDPRGDPQRDFSPSDPLLSHFRIRV